jgi:hypothetical protein
MNKKAVFYTLAGVIFVMILVFAFYILEVKYSFSDNNVVLSRVKTANNFVKNVDRDLHRALYISSLRATLSLEEKIVNDGSFISDSRSAYKEAIMNGTINNVQLNLMIDSTFNDWVDKIKVKALETGIIVEFNVSDIDVYQDDPWHVKSRINVSVMVTDTKNTSSWVQDKIIVSSVDIIGFEDPLYSVNSYGRIANMISATPYEGNYVSGGDVSNFVDHVNNSYYSACVSAPDFLMRFENNLSSSPYGIESFINLDKVEKQGLSIKQKTGIDYIYWSSVNTTNYRVNDTPEWLYIDANHTTKYQVDGLIY